MCARYSDPIGLSDVRALIMPSTSSLRPSLPVNFLGPSPSGHIHQGYIGKAQRWVQCIIPQLLQDTLCKDVGNTNRIQHGPGELRVQGDGETYCQKDGLEHHALVS